jgi:hypothetical protein
MSELRLAAIDADLAHWEVAFRLNQALFTELGQNIDGYRR